MKKGLRDRLGEAERPRGRAKGSTRGRVKLLEPAQEQAEVVAGSGEHGVDAVAIAAREIVAAHAVILLEVADDAFDGGATAHLAAGCLGDTPDPAADPDLEPVRIVVAAIALVAVDAADRDTCKFFEIGDGGAECVAIIWVAVQRLPNGLHPLAVTFIS